MMFGTLTDLPIEFYYDKFACNVLYVSDLARHAAVCGLS